MPYGRTVPRIGKKLPRWFRVEQDYSVTIDGRDTLDSNIDPTTAHVGHWTADEDTKLRDAVPAQGSKNREVIARMIPGRTKKQGNRSSRGQKLNGE
jgi:hypothetical protein